MDACHPGSAQTSWERPSDQRSYRRAIRLSPLPPPLSSQSFSALAPSALEQQPPQEMPAPPAKNRPASNSVAGFLWAQGLSGAQETGQGAGGRGRRGDRGVQGAGVAAVQGHILEADFESGIFSLSDVSSLPLPPSQGLPRQTCAAVVGKPRAVAS